MKIDKSLQFYEKQLDFLFDTNPGYMTTTHKFQTLTMLD